ALASDDGVPAGAILFFDTPTCPDGWERESAYDGRYLVIAPAGGTIGALAGPPLSDVERRALPDHTHLVSGTTGTVSFFGSDVVNTGGPIYDGRLVMDSAVNDRIVHHVHGVSIASSATSAGVGADVAPYVQLLACRRR